VNSLPKTVTRQRRDCDLNPDPSAPESSTLTTRLPSHPRVLLALCLLHLSVYDAVRSKHCCARDGDKRLKQASRAGLGLGPSTGWVEG